MSCHHLEFLRTQHPFHHLSETELQDLAGAANTADHPAGARILVQGGAPSTFLYVLLQGEVDLLRDGQVVKILEPGDCFGYPSLIGGTPPAFHAEARAASTVCRIPAPVFQGLLGNRRFAEYFLKDLGDRLRQVTTTAVKGMGGELSAALGELGLAEPVTIAGTATVGQAAVAMRDARQDVVLVTGESTGIITDHDFQVKVLAEGRGPDTLVDAVATRPVKTLPADTPVHAALLFMLENRIHHLPVTRDGRLAGLVSATDLLRHQTRNPLFMMRQLENLQSREALGSYAGDLAGMVERLFFGGLKVAQIGRITASMNDALLRRLLDLAERDLGEPPCPYAWLVFGSEGRMEQALITDQDNALAYAEDTPEAARYFAQLAARVVADLQAAGFPECPGGYMATNWCRPLAWWEQTVRGWIDTPTGENLMVSAIFFDYRNVAGGLSTAGLDAIIAGAGGHRLFQARLAGAALNFRAPMGMFRRIRNQDGLVDLKTGGLAPLVSMGRVYGLEASSRARTTRERFEAAMAAGLLDESQGRDAVETYRFLLQLRLGQQLAALKAGDRPGNSIRLDELTSLEHRHLKDAFQAIGELQGVAGRHFQVQGVG